MGTKLLRAKSKNAYEKVYVAFKQWMSEKGVKEVVEDVILTFLHARVSTSIMLGLCSSIIYHVTFIIFKMYSTVPKIVPGIIMAIIFHVEGN